MKVIRTLLASFTAVLICMSCAPNDADDFHYHTLFINVVDADGESLVADMECDEEGYRGPDEPEDLDVKNMILPKYYTLTAAGKNFLTVSDEMKLGYNWISGKAYLNMCFITLDNPVSTVTWSLTCEHMFGDREIHSLIADYVKTGNRDFECVSLSLDGTPCDVEPGGFVTIRVSRE